MLFDTGQSNLFKKTLRVPDANLNYIGSIIIDEDWMLMAGLYEYGKVYILNINNGKRFGTYVIKGENDNHDIILNTAAAR